MTVAVEEQIFRIAFVMCMTVAIVQIELVGIIGRVANVIIRIANVVETGGETNDIALPHSE